MTNSLLTPEETLALESPHLEVIQKIERLFPLALNWYQAVEEAYGNQGRSLSEREVVIACKLGITKPENVRIVVLESFPLPNVAELLSEARRIGFGSNDERGRTNGYVIMLKPSVAHNPMVITHELVHVSQIERLGCSVFVRRYLLELEVLGYSRSPLELEAFEKQTKVW